MKSSEACSEEFGTNLPCQQEKKKESSCMFVLFAGCHIGRIEH